MAESNIVSGLRGVVAGATALSSVGAEGDSLRYRGYDIEDLVEQASFEEVAYLLLYGHLPTRSELDAYLKRLRDMRSLPAPLKDVLGISTTPGSRRNGDILPTISAPSSPSPTM
jgi:2-methylcitrate synthase